MPVCDVLHRGLEIHQRVINVDVLHARVVSAEHGTRSSLPWTRACVHERNFVLRSASRTNAPRPENLISSLLPFSLPRRRRQASVVHFSRCTVVVAYARRFFREPLDKDIHAEPRCVSHEMNARNKGDLFSVSDAYEYIRDNKNYLIDLIERR